MVCRLRLLLALLLLMVVGEVEDAAAATIVVDKISELASGSFIIHSGRPLLFSWHHLHLHQKMESPKQTHRLRCVW